MPENEVYQPVKHTTLWSVPPFVSVPVFTGYCLPIGKVFLYLSISFQNEGTLYGASVS